MEELKKCPACGSAAFTKKLVIKDYFLSNEDFNLDLCNSCGLIFTNPRPDESESARYYQSEEYISHSNKSRGIFASLYQYARSRNLKWKESIVNQHRAKGKITDIGCGTGEFLAHMKIHGWETQGFEPDENARKQGIENFDLSIRGLENINDIADGAQDIVSMWHVLEHVHNLDERLKQIHRILKSQGLAFIALPNPESPDAVRYKKYWAAWDVPRHLYHFPAQTVKSLFQAEGFEHVSSHSMKFDSYYVSMLSERYKNSVLSPVRGIVSGFRSNMKAGKNPELYSSVLYIFRKV